ncbi:MAG: hypothetical protein ABF242_03630 [Flavobacteriales bacterium]
MELEKKEQKPHNVTRLVLAALFFMMTGIGIELYLLGHYEDIWQLIPIIIILSSLFVLLLLIFKPSNFLAKFFNLLMLTTALSGVLGIILHLKENFEFEQEMVPNLGTWELFIESLSGALPSLAPASLIVLALIGYTYTTLIKQQTHEH